MRSWRHLWLEGGFGYSRFASGFGDDESFPDPFTGEFIPLPVHSGWSPLWNAAVRYEFQPTKRDRLLAEVQLQTADRDGPLLRFLAIRFGYRAF